MKEPVNIMGVVAFPNEDGKRDCRFIDPHYNELFTVPDGGNVVLTYIDGTKKVLPCTYIDDYHVKVGSGVYHICEFAERMHESGTVYQPEHPNGKEKYGIYEIYQISDLKTAEYLFEFYDRAKGKIKPTDYRRAYAGMLPEKSRLDDIFMEHNRDTRPFGREMRSMSVSDIIVVTRAGEKHAYYHSRFKASGQERFWVRNANSAANLNTIAHIAALAVAYAAVLNNARHSYRAAKALRRAG